MKKTIIDLNDVGSIEINYNYFKFNDGEPHLCLDISKGLNDFVVKTAIQSPEDLFRLLMVANILDRQYKNYEVHITYLMGQRMDRDMGSNRPVTLNIMQKVLDLIHAKKIIYSMHNEDVFSFRHDDNYTLIRPDRIWWDEVYKGMYGYIVGADKSALKHFTGEIGYPVSLIKIRDVNTGKITSIEPTEKLRDIITNTPNAPLVFVDDLCDMGGTFIAGLDKLRELGWRGKSTLFVIHAPVNKGIENVCKKFDRVITTDTCPNVKKLNIQNLTIKKYE